jgi:CubicO group peptidase (beta-lactamase class C family)
MREGHEMTEIAQDYIRAIEGKSAAGQDPFDWAPIEEVMGQHQVPGMSLAIIKDFQIHWAKGYGLADPLTGTLVGCDTLFQAGSISKPVAAMALLKAVQDGKFSLDDDINEVLRSWQLPDGQQLPQRRVTPRMLASHTSGLGDGFGFPGYDPQGPLPSLIQILDGLPPSNVGPVRMEYPPSSIMKYSGGGSTILQLALCDAYALPFREIMQHEVIDPIGMTASAYEQPLSHTRDRIATRGHDGLDAQHQPKWRAYPELFAAGLWTTAVDLAKFLIEVQLSVLGRSNAVLSPENAQLMMNPVGIGEYAIGFAVEERRESGYIQHGGVNWGFVSLVTGHKTLGYGLAVMTNSSTGHALVDQIRRRVETVYGWDQSYCPTP